ncbi:MAG: hypothetical protein QW725_02760 [Ignisphaera sp.]
MFLSSGNIVETVEADLKSLGRVLREYITKKFTGHINYRNVVQGVYISISMVDGNVVGCRAVDRGVVYEGTTCSDTAMRYLYQPDGVIEVVDVSKRNVLIDLVIFPLSRLEERTALITSLGSEAVVTPTAPTPTEAILPPATKPKEEAPAASVESVVESVESAPQPSPPSVVSVAEEKAIPKQAETIVPPQPSVPPTPTVAKEISISNECIDPLTLYSVIRSSKIVESVPTSLSLDEVIEKIKRIVQEKRPRYVYVSGNIEEAFLRLVHDTETANIYIELEKDGAQTCGNNALKTLENKQISNIRIWTISP